MEDEINGAVPCSSLAVDSILRVGTAGAIWGLCMGPYDARKQGLSGVARASFVLIVCLWNCCIACIWSAFLRTLMMGCLMQAKAVGKFGFQYGLIAGIYKITRCGIQRYRRQNDWVNGLVAGALAGAAFAARTRSWTQVIGMAGLVSVFSAAADYSRTS